MSAPGMRKAAMVLASLHPRDRAWVLEQLRPTWRYDLKRLIRQAADLGADNPALTRDAIAACEREAARPEPPTPDHLLAGLQGLSPEWTARALAACAPDHLDLYAANAAPEQVRRVRGELLNLPKILPPKLADTLTGLVRARGERALIPMQGRAY